jgi:hypothetical protein
VAVASRAHAAAAMTARVSLFLGPRRQGPRNRAWGCIGKRGKEACSNYRFRLFDGHDVEVEHDLFVVTTYHYEVNGLALVNVELLMRHKRREVNKITTTYFC